MLCSLARMNGLSGTGMFTKYDVMEFMSGGETQDIISKAEWRILFIATRQALEGNSEQGQNGVERLKRK